MSGQPSVLVTLDGEIRDPHQPLLFHDDFAAVRGDGVFETLLVREGRACKVEAHLRRLGHSAAMLDLPALDPAAWRRAIGVATAQWESQTSGEGALRLVYTRGRESGGPPTAYLMISPVAERVVSVRRDGISALLLDRGLPATGTETMPWLLAGAKTLSYAVNMAAIRHAADRGADDVVFVSSDGYILEGPRSTVVIATDGADGRTRLLTPPPSYPILRGTTQHALFAVAEAAGFDCGYQELRAADLFAAQGLWLISSITLAARVHTLDGRAMTPAPLTAEMTAMVEKAVLIES